MSPRSDASPRPALAVSPTPAGNGLVHVPAEVAERHELLLTSAPEMVLQEASIAARALKGVIEGKDKQCIINGKQYLEFEDWSLLGRFYGITAATEGDPQHVEFPNPDGYGVIHGFRATAIALREGKEISRATAFCLTDEEKWGDKRPIYEWHYVTVDGELTKEDPGADRIKWIPNPKKPDKRMPQKERVLKSEGSVPLFQLASMAQTRAMSKVLRNVLSFAVVLAGYKPTPAEEMTNYVDGEVVEPARATADKPTSAVAKSAVAEPQQTTGDNPRARTGATKLPISPPDHVLDAPPPAPLPPAIYEVASQATVSDRMLRGLEVNGIKIDTGADGVPMAWISKALMVKSRIVSQEKMNALPGLKVHLNLLSLDDKDRVRLETTLLDASRELKVAEAGLETV